MLSRDGIGWTLCSAKEIPLPRQMMVWPLCKVMEYENQHWLGLFLLECEIYREVVEGPQNQPQLSQRSVGKLLWRVVICQRG